MHLSDQVGLLSKTNIRNILSYYKEYGKESIPMFSEEDLDRFNQLCPDKYSDDMDSSVVEEEVIVEMDECPVELIED